MQENTAQQVATAAGALPVGTMLSGDQFTITGHLGAGGFGKTYRAKDNVLGRTIVMKECFADDFCYREGKNVIARKPAHEKHFRSFVKMFMREAQSLAKLRHPNIVAVHRAFEENNTAYMVLDLIDGMDLFDILETTTVTLSPRRIKDILLQLLDAIEKIHEMDLLHRDISPDNIILEQSGAPVLIDFGAARGDASRRTRAISSLLVIKDGYSPQEFYVPGSEQFASSDLYALGATFYHAVSGKAPVNSQIRIIEVSNNKPDPCIPLAGRFDAYEPAFLKAIDSAMRIHPSDRLQSAAQWRNLISDGRTERAANANLPDAGTMGVDAADLSLSLSKLVQKTNDEVRQEVRKTKLLEIKAVKSEPAPVKATSVPEWVEEFNQETLAPDMYEEPELLENAYDLSDFEDDDLEPLPASRPAVASISSRVPTRLAHLPKEEQETDTNWVNRALEKQERLRAEREQELALPKAGIGGSLRVKSKSSRLPELAPAITPKEPEPAPSILLPLVKMLIAGVTIGLIFIFGINWLFPGLLGGA